MMRQTAVLDILTEADFQVWVTQSASALKGQIYLPLAWALS